MKVCVGAASRRVVEEAAKLQVHQILASRRQVDTGGGYIGMDQFELVSTVNRLSDGRTQVVRDHGGPNQGGKKDDGTESFDVDVRAGFHGLHIDVCNVPEVDQTSTLVKLATRYARGTQAVSIEVGGEHTDTHWNIHLLNAVLDAGVTPMYCVINPGTHVWRDRQFGRPMSPATVKQYVSQVSRLADWVGTKMHNADWWGDRHSYDGILDAYNVAPEYGMIEVDALLTVLPGYCAQRLLNMAEETESWTRWFKPGEGTWLDHAKCALRYHLEDPEFADLLTLMPSQELFVRGCVRDAIKNS